MRCHPMRSYPTTRYTTEASPIRDWCEYMDNITSVEPAHSTKVKLASEKKPK